MQQLVFDLAPPPRPSLENFVVGPNGELLAQLRALLAGSGERWLYLWGGSGCGKTHLLRALADAAPEARLCAAGTLCDAAESTASPLLLIDEVTALDAEGQQRLFNILIQRREDGAPLVATGPYAPQHLKLRADLTSRLAQCLVLQVKCLSDEDKVQALVRHALGRGFTLPMDVAQYLLRHWRRDIPALLAVLEVLDRYSLADKRPITLPLTREVLARLASSARSGI